MCLNSRELLFGAHPVRYEVHQRIAAAWGAPRASDFARLADNSLRTTFGENFPMN